MSHRPFKTGDRVTVTERYSSFEDQVHDGVVTHVAPVETTRSGALIPPIAYIKFDASYVSPVTGKTITQTVICLTDDMTAGRYPHALIEHTGSTHSAASAMESGDWLQRVLRRHCGVGTGDPSNWECGGCGDIITGRDTDDEPDDEHVLDALAAHQAAAVRTAAGVKL